MSRGNVVQRLDRIEALLSELVGGSDEVLTIEEAAEFVHLSKGHLYHLTSCDAIPHSKVGKRLRFSKRQLKGWLMGESGDHHDHD